MELFATRRNRVFYFIICYILCTYCICLFSYLEAEDTEKTYKFSQNCILEHVDQQTKAKSFDIKLNQFGPYRLNYLRNGRFHVFIINLL
jgi:hypothetical protein